MKDNDLVSASRRRLLLGTTTGVAASALGMAWPGAATAAQTPVRGGTLAVSLFPEPGSLAPVVGGVSVTGSTIISNIFEGLVTFDDATFAPKPGLAESWTVSPDGKRVTFRLRRAVQWHDGAPFTSADVRYTLLELTRKYHSRGIVTFANLTNVQTPDRFTATLVFSEASNVFWKSLDVTDTQIYPKHLYENTDLRRNPYNVKPVGTGPFVFQEWERGSHVALARNPAYWDKGTPYLERVVFRFIPDAATRAAAQETGDIHLASLGAISLSDAVRLRKDPGLVLDTSGFEARSPIYFFDFNLRRKVFQDIRVRQAFAHAIDRAALARVVWYGLAKPATGPIPSSQTAYYNAQTPQYPFDLKRAEQLLDEAGLARDRQGVRLRVDHLALPYGDDFVRSAEFIRESLKRIGVELKLRSVDWPTFQRIIWTDADYDTVSQYYSAGADPQIGVFRRYWTKAIQKGVGSTNNTAYSSAQTDALIERIQSTLDGQARNDLIRKFQVQVQQDLPSINLLELQDFRIRTKRLHGLDRGPFGGMTAVRAAWLDKA